MTDNAIEAILKRAQPHEIHDWLLPSRDVAEGFGVDSNLVRAHKSNHNDELKENHHWVKDGIRTLWTKAGVIRLGMFIKSDRAIAFRDAAEAWILSAMEGVKNINGAMVLSANPDTERLLAPVVDKLAEREIEKQIEARVDWRINQILSTPSEFNALLGKLGYGEFLVEAEPC